MKYVAVRICFLIISLIPFCLKAQIFTNSAPQWGITQHNWDGVYGSGVSTVDWNMDGWDDLTFGNSSGGLRTFINNQGNGFTSIHLPIIQLTESKSIMWLDIDDDGDMDFYYSDAFGRVEIIENIYNTSFVNVTAFTNIAQVNIPSEGSSWGDYDNDGDLDLYICRYYESGEDLPSEYRNVLMRNDGDFQFTDVTAESFTGIYARASFQSVWYDWDRDGFQDLFVINDKDGANTLFHNLQNGQFEDIASQVGLDVSMDAMSATLGDYNSDGITDIYISDSGIGENPEGSKLFRGTQSGVYIEESVLLGLNLIEFCWAAVWMDIDNDTDLDLFISEHDPVNPYQENFLFENSETGAGAPLGFNLVSTDVYNTDLLNSHTVASGDFDRNGWIDFVVHNVGNHTARIWMNSGVTSDPANYIQIGLLGQLSNTVGVGSWIEVSAGGITQAKSTHCGENYLGQEGLYEHFGLGETSFVDSLKIQWTSGITDKYYGLDIGINTEPRALYTEGYSACPHVSDTTLCGPETVTVSATPFWEAAEVVWSYQETAPQDLGLDETQPYEIVLSESIEMTLTSSGFYKYTVSHQGTMLCESSFHITNEFIGDLTGDGVIGSSDILVLISEFGCISNCSIDFNSNGSTDINDLIFMLAIFGESC
jgi:hypothetical protein